MCVLLLTSAVMFSGMSEPASAQTPKDGKFLTAVGEGVAAGIASVEGSQLAVNEMGKAFATYMMGDGANRTRMVKQAKAVCRELNAASRKGAKATRAKARQMGKQMGDADRSALEDLDGDARVSQEDKFSIGLVVGLVSGAVTRAGVGVYCPRHNKQVSTILQAWQTEMTG